MGTTGLSITLANSIIGVGILAMPFCFQQCGVLLATLILLSMGLISRLCCYFLLKSALLARRRNFEFLAFHVFGPAGKMAVEIGIIGFLMGTCIAYFVVVGDLGPQIVAKMFNINQSDILRTSIMVIVSLVCVLPLGLLRNVDSLSNVSAATIAFYFCLVMKVIAEAASQLLTVDWQSRVEMWKPAGVLQCVPIFSMALFCQTQLFEIFESLPSLSLEKMTVVTKNAINICTGVYFTLGVFGYIAFSSQDISGNILMSLSPTMGSDVIKLGFVMSLAFSFPLIIFPCRASLYSFLYKKVHSSHHDHIINHSIPESAFRCITVAIIAVALFISLLIPNIELVLGLVGSTIGVLICVVFPAACFVNITFKNTNERVLAKAVVVFGLIMMVLGTYANLQAAENQIDRFDDKYITQDRIDKMVEDFFQKEKSEEINEKPISNNPISRGNVISNDIIKDSEVQPPNPVPPESQSNEKQPETIIQQHTEDKGLKEVLTNVVNDPPVKSSETHPKDLKTKLNGAKLANGDSNVEKTVEKKEVIKPASEDDKLHIIKQQKLIETIKQHGEEQKELIKEQKEIIDEIIKTQNELQKDKKDDSDQAKIIAVESIKQIANMAIQSIGGVTEKPVGAGEVKEEQNKLTNEAVQEIAKKAVETIEAIKEIKEKPDKEEVKVDSKLTNPNIQSVNDNPAPIQNNVVPNIASNFVPNIASNVAESQKNNEPNSVNAQAQVQKDEVVGNKQVDANIMPVLNNGNNIKETAQSVNNNVPNQAQKQPEKKNVDDEIKTHSHSPDEPQSYKIGEDVQKKAEIVNNVVQNVPLPLAMNKANTILNNNVQVNDAKKSAAIELQNEGEKSVLRQKREVVDCTEKMLLKPEDKQICEKLIGTEFKDSQEILKNIDLNDVGLRKNVPFDLMSHIGRALKSFDETEKRR